ncbi:hypothetical protein RSAG8_08675, partial [Rhizoctonia solani AG-8 WAC10335]
MGALPKHVGDCPLVDRFDSNVTKAHAPRYRAASTSR